MTDTMPPLAVAKPAAPPLVPFRDVLQLGSTGTQPVAVKRGLWHAGFHEGWDSLGDQAISQKILGELAVANLKTFQRYHGLKVDGVYGEQSHMVLRGSFDDYAVALYMTDPHPPAGSLQLPANFVPTHPTGGLPGYPAIDEFALPGSKVLAPATGVVTKLSGHDPRQGGVPGGAYGWSIYLTVPHAVYYMTHFATRDAAVHLGATIKQGQVIGTVCDSAVDHLPSTSSHIHLGKHVE